MYTGPLKLGDPNFRGLLKREQDPLITQRMRECATRELCKNFRLAVNDCGKEYGQFYRAWNYGTGGCRKEADELADCVQSWLDNDDLREMMTLEYLNERSHYRQTGIKTVRFGMDRKYIDRDERIHGPSLDEMVVIVHESPRIGINHIMVKTLHGRIFSMAIEHL